MTYDATSYPGRSLGARNSLQAPGEKPVYEIKYDVDFETKSED